MDDNYNKFGRDKDQSNGREWDPSRSSDESNASRESNSSYYYSYGPFKSFKQEDGRDSSDEGEHYNRREPGRVEVTPPQPVKPLPYQSQLRQSGGGYVGERRGQGGDGGDGNGWNYNRKPKGRFKSAALSFLAGMLVVTGSMFAADYYNWFTPGAAATVSAPQGTAVNESAGARPTTSTTSLNSSAGSVADVVDSVGPAVVKIETLVNASSRSGSGSSRYDDPFYRFFFGDQYGGSSSQQSQPNSGATPQLVPYGIGTGFIYDSAGYILTNQHVVDGADVIQVTVEGNSKPYEAQLLGFSEDLDLAVLKIEGEGFPSVALGDSDAIKVGSQVVAIGNPQGFDHTVTGGYLSAKERSIDINDNGTTRNYKNLLQTDASINPGNSGGPLLDMGGQVIGMNVAVSADAQGIGFAIPVNKIKEVLDNLEANEEIPKDPVPFIGASLITITDEVASQLGIEVNEGSVVREVVYRSPAYNADLRPYDIITGMNGTKFATSQELIEHIQTLSVGDEVTLNVVRDGNSLDLKLQIGDRNEFANQLQQQQQQQ